MKKAYKYRLYPTKKQERVLHEQLALCAELYNAALQERKDAYTMCGKTITFTQQCSQLPAIKEIRPEYEAIYSQVLQDVLHRVDKAFKAFFLRVKAGQTPGYPRYTSRFRYASLTYPQTGFGIDVGLKTFAFLSTGERIANPRFFREEEKHLAKANRRLSQTQRGTPEQRTRRKIVARVHERIGWRRENFVGQESRKLVKRFGLLADESLVVRSMVKRPKSKHDEVTGQYVPNGARGKAGLNTSIADAAWSAFFTALVAKAEEAGRHVVKVPPAFTTQACYGCGHRQVMPLSVRVYTCGQCAAVRDRDHNASLNILQAALGRQSVVLGTEKPPALVIKR